MSAAFEPSPKPGSSWHEAHARLVLHRQALEPEAFDMRVDDPKRVGVIGLAGVGGSGKVAAETASGLSRRGHDVTWLSAPDPAFVERRSNRVVLDVPREPTAAHDGWVSRMTRQVGAWLERAPVDVLFVHYVTGHLEATIAARDAVSPATRVVGVVHGSDITRFAGDATQRRRMRDALVAADEVVAVSGWLAEQTRRTLDLCPAIRVIDNAVDVHRFQPARRDPVLRATLAPAQVPLLIHVSNMRAVKRAADAVEVLAELRRGGLDGRLSIVGEGPEREAVTARAEALGLSDRVEAKGNVAVDALPGLVAASDVMLVTSSSESFSLVAMEALAAGVAVVGTRCGGLERVLEELVTDGGVPPVAVGDTAALAAGVETLWSDPRRRERVAMAGMRMAIEVFPRARQLRAYAEIVEGDPS